MATLPPFFGNHTGMLKIYVSVFAVGSGNFAIFDNEQVKFAGSYTFFTQDGAIALGLKLTDNNPAATTGTCAITLNSQTDNAATYQVVGEKLSITTTLNDGAVQVYSSQNGTQIDGVSGHNVWIG
jgi:hypothetical protein